MNGVKLGRHSYVGLRSIVNNCNVGRFTCIGPNVIIGIGDHPVTRMSIHPIFYSTRKQSGKSFVQQETFVEKKVVNIGNDVWIGCGVVVKEGVQIGDGAIIGAGSVVTKDVAPFSVVGGVPAKLIKMRLSEPKRAEIIANPWWNLTDCELHERAEEFQIDY
jgi:acetyltransferase-like isoleucine patch superfamily enzyme